MITKNDKFVIEGGHPIGGEITVKGAKNQAVKVMAAALLADGPTTITNLPQIEDVERITELLTALGATVKKEGGNTIIDPSGVTSGAIDPELVRRTRSSILLVGPLLVRLGQVQTVHPGGCQLGQRAINFFIDGFRALGARVTQEKDLYTLAATNLAGTTIVLERQSPTATEALMMTAALVPGTTIIKNAALEPEIPALADYLNEQGAKISGAGTTTITITGVKRLSGGTCTLIPDRIEAGTFTILGILANTELTIRNCDPEHLDALLLKLRQMGAQYEVGSNFIQTRATNTTLLAQSVTTHEYPGFATDYQAPYTVLMTQCQGQSLIHEVLFDGRLFYTDALKSMGANIVMCDPHRVLIHGKAALHGAHLASPDIRAGIALIMAGLVAHGITTIDNVYQVDRGYEAIDERLQALGAHIKRVHN